MQIKNLHIALWAGASLLAAQDLPAPVKSSITVTGTISADVPGNIAVMGRQGLEAAPGVNLDDRLRTLPGFSLLRRSSSVVAHPTTQGVSLRGIGSNGASRTLVLWDGIPLNDPFGGWVYWTRVPPEEIERIEVSPGAPASVFGDRAMGGVISLFSREPRPNDFDARFESGAWGSADTFAAYSTLGARWAVSAGGRAFRTDGYYIVPEYRRGAADRRAGVDFATGFGRFDVFGATSRLFLKIDLLAEERRNGTVLQNNSTGLGTVSAHYERASISLIAWHSRESFRSVFSSVSADRASERLTFRQTAPANGTGGAALWQHRFGGATVKLGADSVRSEGSSTDRLAPTGIRTGGGVIWTRGAFGQGDYAWGPVRLFAGLRGDSPGRGPGFLSPSAGIAASRGPARAWVSFYRSFRAPTLNELYRQFQTGNVLTMANNALAAERMTSVETGISVALERTRFSASLYRDSLDGFITNVTLSASPQLIVRQRQNAGAGLARGVEVDARRQWGQLGAHLGYLFADSRFATGLRIPQVARHQGSADLVWDHGKTFAAAGVRALGSQFDDDRNSFLLPGYATAFLSVRRRISRSLSVFAGLDNLLDRAYLVALTPYPNTGAPRYWRLGLRWETAARTGAATSGPHSPRNRPAAAPSADSPPPE